MNRQKRAMLINDVTGFSRCSIAAMLPILSAMKIQTSFVPTAILSLNTYFENHYITDYTKEMSDYIQTYKDLDLTFDNISSGFLGSAQQIDIVIDFINHFKKENTFILIDPVMGDNGKIYPNYTDEMCFKMRTLVRYAHIITPNITELSILVGKEISSTLPTYQEIEDMCKTLAKNGPKKIVVTGIQDSDTITNFIYEDGFTPRKITTPKIGIDRSGTGDVFSAVIIGYYMQGLSFYDCINKAVDFVSKCLTYTDKLQLPYNHGLCFEEYLTQL